MTINNYYHDFVNEMKMKNQPGGHLLWLKIRDYWAPWAPFVDQLLCKSTTSEKKMKDKKLKIKALTHLCLLVR